MIKTFRGLLADGGQDTIRLSTNNGLTGYRIVKFEIMTNKPGATAYEHVMKIWKTKQTTIDGLVDFSIDALLGAGYLEGHAGEAYPDSQATFFDQEVFNQDIFVTQYDVLTGEACNYYIELEQVKLAQDAAAVATLKDMRGRE